MVPMRIRGQLQGPKIAIPIKWALKNGWSLRMSADRRAGMFNGIHSSAFVKGRSEGRFRPVGVYRPRWPDPSNSLDVRRRDLDSVRRARFPDR